MDINFDTYFRWIQKYISNHDTREINFQNDVVKRLLEYLYPSYDIVCVDTKCNDSKTHDYYKYSGKYVDSKGKVKPTTPDLLVCRNWDWFNKDNNCIDYIATIEVKSPYGSEAIWKKEFMEYHDFWKVKIKRHLDAEKISKVIFTDTFKWDFFLNEYNNHESVELVKRVKRGRGYTYEWRTDAEEQFDKLILLLNKYI